MKDMRFIVTASASALQKSDVFMSIQCIMFAADEFNKNGVAVTEAFIDEIVNNQNKYVGLPLYCDVAALLSNSKLTHGYDEETDTFHNNQIGSFVSFEKQIISGKTYLIGIANCPKRDNDILTAVSKLFASNELKFSFEISCGEYTKIDEQHIIIDASENNFFEGLSIVSIPACEEAIALDFCAEEKNQEDDVMNEENTALEINVETPEVNAEVIAEANEGENITAEETTEEIVAEQSTVQSESATEETAIADSTETAAAIEEAECKKNSEDEEAECCKKSEEETAGCCKKSECNDCNDDDCDDDEDCENALCKKAEIDSTDIISLIKSLEERIVSLETKLSEINTAASTYSSMFNNNSCFTSEQHSVVAEEINPMTSDITIESEWTLLEREEPITTWTLI